jgi:hypothetical protein
MSQEVSLNEIAEALNVLARYGLLYGGFKRKQRRVVEVRSTATQLVIKYEDGGVYYIDKSLTRRFTVYTRPPRQQQ